MSSQPELNIREIAQQMIDAEEQRKIAEAKREQAEAQRRADFACMQTNNLAATLAEDKRVTAEAARAAAEYTRQNKPKGFFARILGKAG